MLRWTNPRLKAMIHSNGSRYKANFKHEMAATYFYYPNKHMPILFHNWAELGLCTAAILYFINAA